jgi:hypothetical protein
MRRFFKFKDILEQHVVDRVVEHMLKDDQKKTKNVSTKLEFPINTETE